MPDIFISYSSKDREQAVLLTELLASAGLSVWIDQAGIGAATSWSGEISKAITDCKALIVLLSPSSVDSKNVTREVALAFERNKKILPIDLEPVTLPDDFAYHLAGIQRAPMTNIDAVIRALAKLGLEATGAPQAPMIVAETSEKKSLMILPFEDLSPTQDNGWFADGLASELIGALSNVKLLRISNHQATKEFKSFRGQLTTYAREMNIRYFIQGDVRKFGDQIKISTLLLDIQTGDHLWQDSLKGTMNDIFDIQETVARKVLAGLKLHLSSDEEQKVLQRGTANTDAYEFYIKGAEQFHLQTAMNVREAARLFSEAIRLDPNFAGAHQFKGNALASLYRTRDRDPEIILEAERSVRLALQLRPDHFAAYNPLTTILQLQGKLEEAEQTARTYIEKAPDEYLAYFALGFFYMNTHQDTKAVEAFERSAQIHPTNKPTLVNLVFCTASCGNIERCAYWSAVALPIFQKHLKLQPSDQDARSFFPWLLFYVGRPEEARSALFALGDLTDGRCMYNVASMWKTLVDPEMAFKMSLGNGTLICVVKAWADDNGSYDTAGIGNQWITSESTNQYGYRVNRTNPLGIGQFYYSDLVHTIFVESAILIATSTDEGEHWSWGSHEVVTNGYCGGSTPPSTVEHPRIAFRPGFDTKGYVVWQQKKWTKNGDYPGPSCDTCTPTAIRITESKIGIRAFKSDGTLYNGEYLPSSINNTTDNNSPGPELPSVAISPEGSIWLAYDRISYWHDTSGNFSKLQWWGLEPAVGYLYVLSASCSISSNGTATYSYASQRKVARDHIMGFYHPGRGYLYAATYEPRSAGTTPSSLANLDGELASGPSIQVACANPRLCSGPYTVGVVHAWGDGRLTTAFGNQTWGGSGIDQSWLSFIFADVHRFGGVSEWYANIPSSNLNKTAAQQFDNGHPFGDQVDWQTLTTTPSSHQRLADGTNYTLRWFPVLKYLTASDGFESFYPDENIQPSFFAMSWMFGFCLNATQSGQSGTYMNSNPGYLDSAVCRTAVSFDNHSFTLVNQNTSTNASPAVPGPEFWGSKIDVCGDGNNFLIHPAWREPTALSSDGNLYVNTGGCTIVRPYLRNYPPANTSALPFINFASTSSGGVTTNFKLLGKFTMGSLPSLSLSSFTFIDPILGNAEWQNALLPQGTGSSTLSNGIFEAIYKAPEFLSSIGDLGMSHQRRIVMTGNVTHCVGYDVHADVSSGNFIWYSSKLSGGDDITSDWTPAFQLATGPNLSSPSVGVYQESVTGKKAIAVVWEKADADPNSTARTYYVRVKEMDGNCDDGSWSPATSFTYTLAGGGSHIVKPVIAPLTWQDPLHSNNRLLLGWTIVYPDYFFVEHNTLLRGGHTDGTRLMNNEYWGDYTGSNPHNLYKSTSWTGRETLFTSTAKKYGLQSPGVTASVTSNENNRNLSDVSQEVVWTGSGYSASGGVWDLTVNYDILDGTNLGNLASGWTGSAMATPRFPAKQSPQLLGDKVWIHRNPCVVISSAGQKHVVWEQMESPSGYLPLATLAVWRSSITLSNTTKLSVPGMPDDWNPVKDLIIMRTPSPDDIGRNFSFLRNPSLTAFPRTTRVWSASDVKSVNRDPEAAELLYWMQDTAGYTKNGVLNWLSNAGNPLGGTFPPHSNLHAFIFNRDDNKLTFKGDWKTHEIGNNATSITDPNPPHRTVPIFPWPPQCDAENLATNAHRSFGPYTDGPSFDHVDPNLNYYGLESYAAGNDGIPANWINVVTPEVGTKPGLKIGTYEAPLSTNMYRSEIRAKNNSVVEFKWGNAYVEDSTLNLATREIILHHGEEDTNGYGTANAIRDSIFATEWFNWPVSASINYDRLMLFPNAGYFDTVNCGDSLYPCYDSVPRWHADTTSRTDSGFIAPVTRMTYIVELVHKTSGRIDTVDRMTYNPFGMKYIQPLTVHLANATYMQDTVMLRVRGDFMGIPENDSSFEFNREMMYGTYPIDGDTTIAVGGAGIIPPDSTGCLQAIGPFPNPSHVNAQNVSILMSYCHAGQTVTVQVYNSTGDPVGDPISLVSDGHSWDRVQVHAPSTPGAYYIRVSAEFLSTTLPYSVTN